VDAGRRLAVAVDGLFSECSWDRSDLVVVGLPRGGVPVAAAVADALASPLDVIVVRKIGSFRDPELGVGAVGEDGVVALDPVAARLLGGSEEQLAEEVSRRHSLVVERVAALRARIDPIDLAGRTVLVVDDGLANGHTARAGCRVARGRGATRTILAVPVAPFGWESDFADEVDATVALETPRDFGGVGAAYRDFEPTTDKEVVDLLVRSRRDRAVGT